MCKRFGVPILGVCAGSYVFNSSSSQCGSHMLKNIVECASNMRLPKAPKHAATLSVATCSRKGVWSQDLLQASPGLTPRRARFASASSASSGRRRFLRCQQFGIYCHILQWWTTVATACDGTSFHQVLPLLHPL